MRILWCTIDRSHRVAQQFDIFRKAVRKIAEVKVLMKRPGGDDGRRTWKTSHRLIQGDLKVDNILLKHLAKDSKYDFIFCDAFFAYLSEEWRKIKIPKAIFIEDVHRGVPKAQIAIAKEHGIPTIFYRFNFAFHKFHKSAKRDFRCIWLPHSANIGRFKDYGEKTIDVLHVGVCPEGPYPWRYGAVQLLKEKPYFELVQRPIEPGKRDKKWPIDDDYAKLLSSAKICITGGSVFNAPVQKYPEIPASGALLMSNWFPDLGLLGFVDGENMVAYDLENIVKRVEDLLADDKKRIAIATAGAELVRTRHNSKIRAKQFINYICRIINKPDEFPKVGDCSFQVNFRRAA